MPRKRKSPSRRSRRSSRSPNPKSGLIRKRFVDRNTGRVIYIDVRAEPFRHYSPSGIAILEDMSRR